MLLPPVISCATRSILSGIFLLCLVGTVISKDRYERGFRERSAALIDQVADRYEPPSMDIGDPEKYYWPKVMARFEKYGTTDNAAVDWIEKLKHRSPFHFILTGMYRGFMPKINDH